MSVEFKRATVSFWGHEAPMGLWTADSASPKVGLSPERLIELAEAGFAPHWKIEGGEPLFKIQELKQWVKDSGLITRHEGKFPPPSIVITSPEAPVYKDLPEVLKILSRSCSLATWPSPYHVGIYFLCDGNEVVYIGQSKGLNGRIGNHSLDKKFDQVFILPCVLEHLDHLEGAFIRAWKPKYNGNFGPLPNYEVLKRDHPYVIELLSIQETMNESDCEDR